MLARMHHDDCWLMRQRQQYTSCKEAVKPRHQALRQQRQPQQQHNGNSVAGQQPRVTARQQRQQQGTGMPGAAGSRKKAVKSSYEAYILGSACAERIILHILLSGPGSSKKLQGCCKYTVMKHTSCGGFKVQSVSYNTYVSSVHATIEQSMYMSAITQESPQ